MRPCVAIVLLFALAPGALAKDAPPKPGKVHALTTAKHSRSWSLYVPSKYSPRSSWPLVISSHGRGGSGAGEMRAWQGLANSHGFIVACPDMVTATNHRKQTSSLPASQEDDEVLMAIYEEITSKYRVNRRAVMITGFSGGGNPSYHSGTRHPDVFSHICTRGGNFAPQQIPTNAEVRAAGASRLHIFIFFGDKDHALIIGEDGKYGQAHAARDALKEAGYENIEFERVPGMGHQSRPAKAAEWFAAWVADNKKLFKAADKADGHHAKGEAALGKEKYRDAIREFQKAAALEEQHGLEARAAKRLEAVNEVGMGLCARARTHKEAGEVKDARKLVDRVLRDFKGLPAADTAKQLKADWKD